MATVLWPLPTERLFEGTRTGRVEAVDRADMMQMRWPLSLKQSELEDMIISAENVVSMSAEENEKMHVI